MTLGVCFMLRRGNVNVLTIELVVITNFEEDSLGRLAKQHRRREAGQGQTKEGEMYARLEHMLKCKTVTF